MAVSRETLYEEIWAEPATKVAERYGVSSSFLARVCERLKVPRPNRGYWARLALGKPPPRPPLGKLEPGDEIEWTRDGSQPRTVPWPAPTAPSEAEIAALDAPVERHSRKEHPLVVASRAPFQTLRESRGHYAKPTRVNVADLFVAKEALERAFQLASRVYNAFEDRGYKVGLSGNREWLAREELENREGKFGRDRPYEDQWSPGRATVVRIGTVAIGLTIYEIAHEAEFVYRDGWVRLGGLPPEKRPRRSDISDPVHKEHVPSGHLAVRAYSPYRGVAWSRVWRETRRGSLWGELEGLVREVVRATPDIARREEIALREAEEEQRRWEAEYLEQQRRWAEEARQKAIKESREQVLALVEQWTLACRIDAFFAKAAKEAEALPAQERAAMMERLRRASEAFGGTEALGHFRRWVAPEERLKR